MVFFFIFSLFSQHTLHFVKSEIAKWGKNKEERHLSLFCFASKQGTGPCQ